LAVSGCVNKCSLFHSIIFSQLIQSVFLLFFVFFW
jgi:hypothetical protein